MVGIGTQIYKNGWFGGLVLSEARPSKWNLAKLALVGGKLWYFWEVWFGSQCRVKNDDSFKSSKTSWFFWIFILEAFPACTDGIW